LLQVPHHGFAADVWSFGVLAYICLSGCHPLDHSGEDDNSIVAQRTRMGDVIPMTGQYWESVSEQARAFMWAALCSLEYFFWSFSCSDLDAFVLTPLRGPVSRVVCWTLGAVHVAAASVHPYHSHSGLKVAAPVTRSLLSCKKNLQKLCN
jgi:hypothetical protein